MLTRTGRVEDGSTVTDHEPEEIARGISLGLGVAPFPWTATDGNAYDVTLLDAPGSADFAGAVDAALAAADLALIVVSAVDGVQAGTHAAWRLAAEAGVPRMVVVTKEDKARADFRHVLADLRAAFGDGLVPLELPLGEETAFTGVADVLSEEGLAYDRDGHHHTEALPAGLADEEHRLHDEVTEEIVAHDDDQLERYLSGEVPTAAGAGEHARARGPGRRGVPRAAGRPGVTGVGVDRLADLLCELGPSPADRTARVQAGRTEVEVAADPAGPTLLYAFRTLADPFVGQVTMFRVLSGTVRNGDRLLNTDHPHRGAHPRAVPAARQGAPAGRRGARRGRSAPSPSSPGPRRGACWRNGPGRARR